VTHDPDATLVAETTFRVAGLKRGSVVGRYVVIDRIGVGGMGAVYAAFDPELDRRVALKLLLPSTSSGNSSEGRSRLQREAQALAKLSHPNIVAVHDVGSIADEVYIAMEFVPGQTLGEWSASTSRSVAQVLAVYDQAARGLAAAHAAGILHRDFKPANVILGEDGRVRVMDFGLARAFSEPEVVGVPGTGLLLDGSLTTTGAIMGTPAYMAPEQHLGLPTGPATDQFALCVALWEALHGTRPYRGRSLVELVETVTSGLLSEPAPDRSAPAWVRRVLRRGLAASPEDRWPSVEALRVALTRDPSRRRRALAVATLVASGLVVAVVVARVQSARSEERCHTDARVISGDWNGELAESIRARFSGTGAAHAESTSAWVVTELDAYAEAWTTARETVCAPGSLPAIEPAKAADVIECLDAGRAEVRGVVQALATAQSENVDRAINAVGAIPTPSACLHDSGSRGRSLAAGDPRRAEVAALRIRIAELGAALSTGAVEGAEDGARSVLAASEATGFAPIVAEARKLSGAVALERVDYAGAQRELSTAFFMAGAAGADDVAIASAAILTDVVGVRLAESETGIMWGAIATMLLERSGRARSPEAADVYLALGRVHQQGTNLVEASAYCERAHAILVDELGAAHPRVARAAVDIASVLSDKGELDKALPMFEAALQTLEGAYGSEHPLVALVVHDFGILHLRLGQYDRARAEFERALRIVERDKGPDHVEVAAAVAALARAVQSTGDHQQARVLLERALATQKRRLGADSPVVAKTLASLGALHLAQGEFSAARAAQQEALAIAERSLGPRSGLVATLLNDLGATASFAGDHEVAIAFLERALALQTETDGADSSGVAMVLVNLAYSERALGRLRSALEHFERVTAIEERLGIQPLVRTARRFQLARARWELTPDDAAASEAVELSCVAVGQAGAELAVLLPECAQWRATHRDRPSAAPRP